MVDSVESQALQYASELLGGHDALARRMGVAPEVLQDWMEGRRELPDDYLLAVLDIVLKAIDAEGER